MKNAPIRPTPAVHAPHPPLTGYYASEQERRGYVGKLFDSTASDYDRIERLLALGSGPWYRRAGAAAGRVSNPACALSTSASAPAWWPAKPSSWWAIPPWWWASIPSAGMMACANLPGVQLIEGRAEAIPFPDASFDFLSMGYALRHIGDLSAAFSEFHRVLKPGGRLCLLEITKPERTWSQVAAQGVHARRGAGAGPPDRQQRRIGQVVALLLGHHRGLRAAERGDRIRWRLPVLPE